MQSDCIQWDGAYFSTDFGTTIFAFIHEFIWEILSPIKSLLLQYSLRPAVPPCRCFTNSCVKILCTCSFSINMKVMNLSSFRNCFLTIDNKKDKKQCHMHNRNKQCGGRRKCSMKKALTSNSQHWKELWKEAIFRSQERQNFMSSIKYGKKYNGIRPAVKSYWKMRIEEIE